MPAQIDKLKFDFTNAIRAFYPQFSDSAEITVSTQAKFGDYQCNSAMKLAKILGKNPRAVAEEILLHVKHDYIEKLEIAGPGFINIWLNPHYIESTLNQMLNDDRFLIPRPDHPKKVIVEFSSPNVAKEMHVGHLRSTIIGEVLARILEFLGEDVLRLNHIGDWGTAFGMLIVYLKENHPEVIDGSKTTDLPSLMQWYKESKKKFDEDAEFKKRSQIEVVKLQSGDPTCIKVWQIICEISRRGYQEIYDLLQTHINERGESFYNPYLPLLIEDLEKKGIIEVSNGAKCIFIEGFKNREGEPLPLMVQKSDGGYNYDTTDLAALKYRIEEDKAERIIVVTDAGQATHFALFFKAGEKAGYVKNVQLDHVPFGLVLGPDGKKFKTRSGETERLIDLINEAVDKAYSILKERNHDLSDEEMHQIAKTLGINAIKYADLSCMRTQDYQFSYERMLRFEGNTAAFLMYAYVRICSIKRKANKDLSCIQEKIKLEHESELALGKHLLRFHETIENVAKELYPHRLADYLFQLAEKFHAFFRDCPVVGAKEENSRLLLSEITGKVLKKGMELLSLNTIEKM